MTQGIGFLQFLCGERPPLDAAPAESIHQGSDTTGAVPSKLPVGAAQPDPGLSRQIS